MLAAARARPSLAVVGNPPGPISGMSHRILIIRPSALGDVCRSVPILVSLRRAWPHARIDWLIQDSFADAVRYHPDLSELVEFPRSALGKAMRSLRLGEVLAWAKSLRDKRYDLVIDAQGLARSGLMAWATRAPRRVGFADAREGGWRGLTERVHVPADMHTVDRMLALVRAAGAEPIADMRLTAPPDDEQQLLQDPTYSSPYVLLAPTSRWPAKLWPADRYAAVASALLDGAVEHVVFTGMAHERGQIGPLLNMAMRDPRVINRIGATSVGQLMALVKHASLIIANDSAALHMAVGFDRPALGLYGPTRISRVGPYRRERDVIQHVKPGDDFDHKRSTNVMMLRITVDEVLRAAKERLAHQ